MSLLQKIKNILKPNNTINLWYFKEADGRNNFGDLLGEYVTEKLSGKRVKYTNIRDKTPVYVTIGSVLNTLNGLHDQCTVWGAGIITKEDEIPKGVKIYAVRGPMAQKRLRELGINPPEATGDPALLMNLLYEPKSAKKYKLGVIPHYVDYEAIAGKVDNDTLVIDMITDDVEKTIDEIASCEYIISSSLHGVIVAHTYGVPAIWVKFSDKLYGDNVKFESYFLSVGIKPYDGKHISSEDIKLDEMVNLVKQYGQNNSIVSFNPEPLLEACPFLENNPLNNLYYERRN